ncbi:hypothetical protein [Arthrobacter oryzae]|nr:hypothetical protein [Arthrobacter oryzae]MDR6504327.1 hypothetical protein [Arthrobacter oryzae]
MNTELLPALAAGGTHRAGRCPRRQREGRTDGELLATPGFRW